MDGVLGTFPAQWAAKLGFRTVIDTWFRCSLCDRWNRASIFSAGRAPLLRGRGNQTTGGPARIMDTLVAPGPSTPRLFFTSAWALCFPPAQAGHLLFHGAAPHLSRSLALRSLGSNRALSAPRPSSALRKFVVAGAPPLALDGAIRTGPEPLGASLRNLVPSGDVLVVLRPAIHSHRWGGDRMGPLQPRRESMLTGESTPGRQGG